jgi:hypothetical protein
MWAGCPLLRHGCAAHVQTRGADPSLRHEVTEVLDAMCSAGLTVLRTWAFCARPPLHAFPRAQVGPCCVLRPLSRQSSLLYPA